jgi:hypothetical protein
VIEYADDFALIANGNDTDDAMQKLQLGIDQFCKIARRLELKIIADKCAVMILGKQKTDKLIRMENTILEVRTKMEKHLLVSWNGLQGMK